MSEEPKKTLYHSELAKCGTVEIKILSELLESSKKKGSFYLELELDGRKRYYTPENAACSMALEGRRGQVLLVEATGSRAEADIAIVQVVEPGASTPAKPAPEPARQQQPVQRATAEPPARQAAPPAAPAPAQQPDDKSIKEARQFVGRNLVLASIALKATLHLQQIHIQEQGVALPDCLLVAIYNTCLFGATSAGIPQKLPTNLDRIGGGK